VGFEDYYTLNDELFSNKNEDSAPKKEEDPYRFFKQASN